MNKGEIKERIDTNKNFFIDTNEINNFIFDENEGIKNLNDLGNYLNGLSILQSNNDVIKRALTAYFLSKEWTDISNTIKSKVQSNKPLEKRELTLLYLQMVDMYSRTGNKYQLNFDPNKPLSGELLTFIKRQYNNQSYSPQTPKTAAQTFQDNQRKDQFGLYTKESPTNAEIPQIPELNESNMDYVYSYCYKLMDWAEASFPNDIAKIRNNVRAEHYDQSKQDLPEYARYDILLFAYQKYCETISNNYENLIRQAGYKNDQEFQQQIERLAKLQEEIQSQYPNLDEALNILQKFGEEVESNKKKYFRNDEELDRAQQDSEEFNNFLERKTKEYKIDEIKASMEKDPETSEEAMTYCDGINKIIEYQEELTQKSESYGDSTGKYQEYIQGNVEISKKYPNINKYIEVQKQYSEFIKGWQNKIDFNKYEKYNQLKEDSGIDKDFHNMSLLGKIIMNPQDEHFPILGVKNAAAERQKKIDTWRDNLQKKCGPAYRLLTSLSGLLNGFISATVGVGTGLGYMILSLCGKDTAELNKRKQFYDNLLKANQSSQQNKPVYDPDSNSINLNWHNGVSTVSSSIAQMLVLITGGSSIGKGFSKIAGTTKNVTQGAQIVGVTEGIAQGTKIARVTKGIAHRAGVFSMAFITNIGQSFQEAKNENLDGGASLAYSMLTSITQSSLELLSPNEILVGGGSNITKELIKNLVKDGSKNSFMMLGKAFLKNVGMEIIEENLQEGLQLAAGNLINMYADNKRGTELGADWSWKNFAQTAIITTLTTGITTGTSYMLQMGNMSENDRATLFNKVVNNEGTYNAVMEMLNKAISGEVKIPNTDITSLQQLKTAFLSVNELGSNLHDAWRNTQVNEDGTYKAKIETTEDKAWIEQHDGQTEVDIVNTPFEELPSDWQHENLEAAKVAESLVYDVIARGDDITPEMIEDMSRKVHEERRKRNPGEKSGIWDVPYEELPESEKVKDRNQILLAIEVTKRNLDNDYFNGKTHKFNISGSQARSNSTVMDNTLNEINEKNKSKKLKQLGEEISKQYEKATGEKIELTEEQLLSVLDAHEQDGVLGELTTGQLKKKVSILSETITNPRVRRFLLEAGFCGSMANMLQAAQNFYQKNQTTIDASIDFVGSTINNAYKSIKKQGRKEYRKEYTIGEEVNVPRSDGSITYGAHIESYDPSTGTYLVVWYQNGQGLEKRVSTEELNNVNGGTVDVLETFDTATGYKVGQQIYVIKNNGSLGQAKVTEIYEDKGLYKVEWQEDGKNKSYFFTEEELDNANSSNTQIQTEELSNTYQEDIQAQEENTQVEETYQFESEPNTERREMSEVPRGCDVVAIGDLHGEYVALKGNLQYAGLAREVNGHLQWTGGNKKVVFQGDILSDRGTDGLKIINEIHQLRQQARSQGGDIDIIVGNHDDFMISYLTGGKGTRFGSGGPLYISMIGIQRPQGMGLTELAKFIGGTVGDFDSLSGRDSNQQILQAMRYSREGRVILEEMCNMKIISQIDDVLYCHTNPTKEMLQYLTNGNLQQNIDILNQKYQGYLRNVLLGESGPCITSKEFNKISDLFLNTDNRDIGGIEKYVDQLRNSGINMISHGHSGGHGEKNGQLIYNIDHTVDINGLKIVDTDFSYGKGRDTQRSHSISVIQQNGGNVITGDKVTGDN